MKLAHIYIIDLCSLIFPLICRYQLVIYRIFCCLLLINLIHIFHGLFVLIEKNGSVLTFSLLYFGLTYLKVCDQIKLN